uniref:Uncharacterized protein n=1 Tax=Physcomitrium patens TaxID=3218 RepID=A0A2K1KNS4_PHYPA|nr:hypothetical protein PHYPA_006332 [Physcomitrium patens]
MLQLRSYFCTCVAAGCLTAEPLLEMHVLKSMKLCFHSTLRLCLILEIVIGSFTFPLLQLILLAYCVRNILAWLVVVAYCTSVLKSVA